MEPPVRSTSGALDSLTADLQLAVLDQRRRAEEMERAATGGSGQRADVRDWGLWGRAHAARRVAEALEEAVADCQAAGQPGPGKEAPTSLAYRTAQDVIEAMIAQEANGVLREALTRALGRRPGGLHFLQRLAQQDESYVVRRAAVEALAGKEDGYPVLCEIAGDRAYDPLARCKAIELLGGCPEAQAVLAGLLRTEKAETIREAAARALAHHDLAAEFFVELLRDPSECVRMAALKALAERNVTAGIFQDLAVHDLSRGVRQAALELAIARGSAPQFLQKIATEDKDEAMRMRAKQALAQD